MQTPASVEVITRKDILERGDSRVIDAVTRAAGISAMGGPNNGGTALVARGFAGNSSVAQLYDGTRLNMMGLGSLSFPFDTWMADRIEVLRGPASVLYGEGAIGGVVNVITKKPNPHRFENEALISYGRFNTLQAAYGSTGPLNDNVSYRFDVSRQHSDGWVDRGDSGSLAVSGQLRIEPTPEFNLNLSYDYARQEPMKYWGTPSLNGQVDTSLRFKNFNTEDAAVLHHDQLARAKAEWSPTDNITITNDLTYATYDRQWLAIEHYVLSPTTGRVTRDNYTDSRHWRTQIGDRLSAKITDTLFGLPTTTVIGVDAAWNDYETLGQSPSYSTVVDPYSFLPGIFPSFRSAPSGQISRMSQSGVFGENRVELTKQLSFITGFRHDAYALNSFNKATLTTTENDPSFTSFRVGAVYALTQDLSLYGQYATGSDPEGIMYSTGDARLTTGRQVEAGVKSMFLDGRAELTFAWYDIVKNNLLTRDPMSPTVQMQVGQQSSNGVELTAGLRLTDTLSIKGNAAFLNAQYDDFTELVSGRPVSRNGMVPTNVPRRTANLNVSWAFADGWAATAGLRNVGARFANTANTVVFPEYTVVDASLQWQASANTTVRLYATNIFDRVYVNGPSLFSGDAWILGEPRSVRLSAYVKF